MMPWVWDSRGFTQKAVLSRNFQQITPSLTNRFEFRNSNSNRQDRNIACIPTLCVISTRRLCAIGYSVSHRKHYSVSVSTGYYRNSCFVLTAPEKPIIKISECSAVNNTVTLSWAAPPLTRVDAYILELDDGAKGSFRVSKAYALQYTCELFKMLLRKR